MATIKDKIGLAMLPSAQSGGASTSTTDYSGTVHSLLPIQYESPNLLINGGFDQDSDWTKGTGWSIGGGKAISDGSQSSDSSLYQANVLTQGKLYKFEFTLSNVVSGSVRLRNGIGSSETYISYKNTNGTYSAYATVVSSNATLVVDADSNFTGSIDNVSVQLVSNGDFQFERSSSATRVGSDGYIKNVEVLSDELVQNGDFEDLGSELVTNGDFSDGSSWDTDTGWTIANGKASQDGTGSGNDGDIIQNLNLDTNKIYKLTLTVTDYTQGTLYVDITNTDLNVTSEGSYTLYFAPTSSFLYIRTRYSGFIGSIDNISVKEVGQNWTFGDGWSITDNGVVTANAPTGNLDQNLIALSGNKYRVTFTISNYISGDVRWRFTGTSNENGTLRSANGTYTEDITLTNNQSVFRFPATGGLMDISNISIKEITDDTDIPRLDFSNAAQPSLLLEPQRINYIQNSEDFTSYLSNASQQVNSSTSPSNGTNATNIYPSSNGIARGISTSITGTSGVDYTISVFVKSNGKNFVYCTNVNNSSYDVWFNLSNGTISGTGSSNATITNYTNDWYRITYTSTSTSTTIWSRFLLSDSDGSTSVTVDGTNGVLFYGFQLEQGSYPTSYIPTNGETNGVTRNADLCNNAGDSTIFNDAEGVLFAEVSSLDGDTSSNREISLSDGTTGNSVRIYYAINYENRITPRVDVGGSTVWVGSVDVTTKHIKVALRYSSAGMDFYVNGVKEVTTTTVPNFTNSLRSLQIRRGDGNTGSDFYGNVRQLLYFNEALSDAELERLTSSDITQVLRNYNRRGELLGATYESTHVQTKLNELF